MKTAQLVIHDLGKVVLVKGASKGTGASLAEAFAANRDPRKST